jgi:hypothetical protein
MCSCIGNAGDPELPADNEGDAVLADLIGAFDDGARWPCHVVPRVPRAVAWARVSTDAQDAGGLSIPEQLRAIRAYAQGHGIEIAAEFHEVQSAYQHEGRRTEFRRMLDTARSDPQIGTILVHELSRFSRDSRRARALIAELRQAGVQVVSLHDPEMDPSTSIGVYMEAITFAKNEAYSRDISFHARKGCRANIGTRDAETGWCYKNGGDPPVGYKAVNLLRGQRRLNEPIIKQIWLLDDTVVAGRQQYEWVRHCLVELAGNGATAGQICEFCENTGLPPRAGRWTAVGWYHRLRPRCLMQYCGHAIWRPYGGLGPNKSTANWLVVENAHPAILTAEEAVVIAAARRDCSARTHSHSRGRVYCADV